MVDLQEPALLARRSHARLRRITSSLRARLPEFCVAFFATMLGVLAAFWLESCHEQHVRRSQVRQALAMALLESQGNVTVLLHAQRFLLNSEDRFPLRSTTTVLARAALTERGLPEVLTWTEVYLLRRYADSIETWGGLLQQVQAAAADSSLVSADREVLRLYRANTAPALARVAVLQATLNRFIAHPSAIEQSRFDSIEHRIDQLAKEYRSGKSEPEEIGAWTP